MTAPNIPPEGELPRCKHGTPLADWSGELLYPRCGCRLNQDIPPEAAEKAGARKVIEKWMTETGKIAWSAPEADALFRIIAAALAEERRSGIEAVRLRFEALYQEELAVIASGGYHEPISPHDAWQRACEEIRRPPERRGAGGAEMTTTEIRVEGLNARVVEAPNLQEKRSMTEQGLERLRISIGKLRKTAEFATVKQFLVSESSEDQPDFPGLRRLILETFATGLDLEIEAVKDRRKREAASL